ncbi:MAG TPA: flagellar brake protein [Luteimonas sp.]|nr:flagellar brake protein [Luteimonas sp.]
MPDADFSHLLDDEEHSQFSLRDPREIAPVLRGLMEARSLISTRLVPGGHACPTALLEVRDDGSLVLDGNRDEAMNLLMASASRMVCTAQLDLVPVRFRLSTPVRIMHEDYVAFVAPWPGSLLRLQRRENYRLSLSVSPAATVHVGEGVGVGRAPAASCLRVLDISGGGVALAVPDAAVSMFQPNMRLPPCLLRLDDAEPLPVAIEVAYAARHEVRGNVAWWRAGCRFVNLPAAIEQQVMQFIFRTERHRNARQRRGG